ncbi:hypothetical protein IE982_09820 [Enterobacter hormaechei]|nr:hypothetical protein [Enterobacter hormaechei]
MMEGAGGGRSIHLKVFLRREDDAWKIYRVRDLTNNHEHPIFNAGAIARGKNCSRKRALNVKQELSLGNCRGFLFPSTSQKTIHTFDRHFIFAYMTSHEI